MREEEIDSPIFWLVIVTGGLIAVFAVGGQLFGSQAISALSGAFSVVLSGLLVLLYRQQKDVLERQERIMEADYIPMLSYANCRIAELEVQDTFGEKSGFSHEAPEFEAYNYGQGRALNIRAAMVVDTGIAVSTPVEERKEKIREMAREAKLSYSVRRSGGALEEPVDSLDSQEGDFFRGPTHFQFLPSQETYSSFQKFEDSDISPGESVTWILVVEYRDVLGNTYRDIPYGQIIEYIPGTPIHKFPTTGPNVENPAHVEFKNVDYREEVVRGGVEKTVYQSS